MCFGSDFSGSPWGVTYGFTLWGAKLFQSIGIPIESFTFWNYSGPKRSLEHSVLSDTSSLINIGMIIGAGLPCLHDWYVFLC